MASEQDKKTGNAGNDVTSTGGKTGGATPSTTAPQNSAAAGSTSRSSGSTGQTGAAAVSAREKSEGGVQATVKNLYNKAKESAVGQTASDVVGQAKDKAVDALDERKTTVATGLTSVADSLRQVGQNLHTSPEHNQIADATAKYSDTLAKQIEKFSGYLENKDVREMLTDLERFARRNPAIFLGGAFALGLLAARFLKSSNRNQALMRRSSLGEGDFGERNISESSNRAKRDIGGGSTETTDMDAVTRPTR